MLACLTTNQNRVALTAYAALTALAAFFAASAFPILPASANGPQAQPTTGDFDPMDMILSEQEATYSNKDEGICERTAGTKAFADWVENYNKGDLKQAEKDWAAVLAILKKNGCGNCGQIFRIAMKRTILSERVSRPKLIWQHLLEATEHAVGPKDRYTAVSFRYLAKQAEGAKDYAKAVAYRSREFEILRAATSKGEQEVLDAEKHLRKDKNLLSRTGASTQRPGLR